MLHNKDQFENELIAVTKVKNEAPYMKEWIEFHKLVGVEKFIIYDNESTDNLKEILQPYVDSGEVVYVFYPGNYLQLQEKMVNEAIKKYRNKTKWIVVFDVDEYIIPVKQEKITDVLYEIEEELGKKIHALAINWVMYGYSGHYSKPKGLLIENYMRSDGINPRVKSIVNPRTVVHYEIHHAVHLFYKRGMNEKGKIVIGGAFSDVSEASTDKIRINHYYTKSYEEFAHKIIKFHRAAQKEPDFPKFDPDFLSHHEDRIMDKYIPLLKKKIK
jgi:predicted HAD superfamily phosphohydrolase YqeG